MLIRLVYVLCCCLLILTIMSFVFDPKYKDGAYEGILAFSNVLSFIIGSKMSKSPELSKTDRDETSAKQAEDLDQPRS